MPTKISPTRDNHNKMLIARFGLPHSVEKMIDDPDVTPEDREEFVRPFRKKCMSVTITLLMLISTILALILFVPQK